MLVVVLCVVIYVNLVCFTSLDAATTHDELDSEATGPFHTVASRPLKVSDIVPAHPTTDVTKIPALSLSLSVMCKSVYLHCFIDDNVLRFASCNLCSRGARSTRTGHLLSSTPPTCRLFRCFRGPAQAAGDHRNGSDIATGMRIPVCTCPVFLSADAIQLGH